MPSKIVDLSARSEIIKKEPFHLHFWECTPAEYLDFLKDPRKCLKSMGIELPEDCRIETTIENHDWLSSNTKALASDNGPVIICNVGGGVSRAPFTASSVMLIFTRRSASIRRRCCTTRKRRSGNRLAYARARRVCPPSCDWISSLDWHGGASREERFEVKDGARRAAAGGASFALLLLSSNRPHA